MSDLTSPEVSAAVPGLTFRQLDYWERVGYVHCSWVKKGAKRTSSRRGSGHQRLWPAVEVEVIRRMVALIAAGIETETAHTVARRTVETGRFDWQVEGIRFTLVTLVESYQEQLATAGAPS